MNNKESQDISVSIQDLVGFIARGAIVAILVAGLVGVAAYLYSEREPPSFRAEATILIARGDAAMAQFGLTPVTAAPLELGAYRVVASSDQALTDALRLMGTEEPTAADLRSLRGRTGVSSPRDASLIVIEGRGTTAADAIARSNALASALVLWDRQRASESIGRVIVTLEQQVEALSEQIRTIQTVGDPGAQDQIDGLVRRRAEQQQQLAYARAIMISADGVLRVLQPADSTVRQVAPRPLTTSGMAALLAVIAVYALLLLRVALDTRLKSSDDVADVSGLQVLAEIPSAGRREDARLQEAASYLRSSILFTTAEIHPRVFMVTSSVAGEGKSTVARHMAESFVRSGYSTLLVDADLRAPSLIDSYDVAGTVPESATTVAWLDGTTELHHVLTADLAGDGQLHLIPQFGPVPNAAELLGKGFRTALGHWLEDYDIVVIDTPPVLAVADPLTIAPHCTGTVLVVDRRRTDRRKLVAAVEVLQRVGVHVLGAVTNNVGPVGSGGGYGTTYGASPARRPARQHADRPGFVRAIRSSGAVKD